MLSGLGGRQKCGIYWKNIEDVAYKFKDDTLHTQRNIIQNFRSDVRKEQREGKNKKTSVQQQAGKIIKEEQRKRKSRILRKKLWQK